MARLLTAAIGVPIVLATIFLLPAWTFFLLMLLAFGWGAVEYVLALGPKSPDAPLWLLWVLLPPTAWACFLVLRPVAGDHHPAGVLLALGLASTVGVGSLLVLGSTPPAQASAAYGALSFGLPYFALPIAAVTALQELDPWWLVLLVAIVWLGDTAAYYIGKNFGRHKMAPIISPNKTWEGAAASLVTAVLAAAAWCLLRRDGIDPVILGVAAATGIAAQMGDLAESLLKRGAGVKDSGHVLPGHGGMWDRMDALLFAAPVLLAGLWAAGVEGVAL
jgi:phosphatidate cytidylyltransferase